jgi:hypothetical protein
MKQLKTSQINDSTHQTNLDAKNDSILRTHARRPPVFTKLKLYVLIIPVGILKKKKTIEPSMKQLKTSQINDSTHQTNLDAKNDSILRTHARRPPVFTKLKLYVLIIPVGILKKKTIEPSMKQLKTSQINDSILRTHARRPPSSRN